jgi:hypothetical protein
MEAHSGDFIVRNSHTVEIETKTVVTLDIDLVAQWFCGLNDEAQADFFIAVARQAEGEHWPSDQGNQWWLVGKHLVTCACGTDEARNMVIELNNGLRAGQREPVRT